MIREEKEDFIHQGNQKCYVIVFRLQDLEGKYIMIVSREKM